MDTVFTTRYKATFRWEITLNLQPRLGRTLTLELERWQLFAKSLTCQTSLCELFLFSTENSLRNSRADSTRNSRNEIALAVRTSLSTKSIGFNVATSSYKEVHPTTTLPLPTMPLPMPRPLLAQPVNRSRRFPSTPLSHSRSLKQNSQFPMS